MAMGRPRKEINEENFERLCQMQCDKGEILHFFDDISEDTMSRWCKRTYGQTFAVAHTRFSAGGKISLRHYQFQLSKTNASMARWLGIQYLNQSEQPVPDGDTEALQAIGRLTQLIDKARKTYDKDAKYDAAAASSDAPEQQGEEPGSGSTPSADAAPPAVIKAKPAKGKAAPRKGVKSK